MAYIQHRVPCCRAKSQKQQKGPLFSLIQKMDQDYGYITLTQEDSDYVNLMIDEIGHPYAGYSTPNENYHYSKYDNLITLEVGSAEISMDPFGYIGYINYQK